MGTVAIADDAGVMPTYDRYALTPREGDVARLLAQGWTNKQIATELTIAPRSVPKMVSAILRKTYTDNRTQVALLFHDPALLGR